MRWVYVSPHFDDVVLSCGGLAWEQVRARQAVEIWNICAGQPPVGQPLSPFAHSLHTRWGTGPEAVLARQREDEAAVQRLGAGLRNWDLPDCIYRLLPDGSWLVNGEEDLWQPVNPQEAGVVERLTVWLTSGLEESAAAETMLVSPLTLGNHVDHFLVRAAAERAAARTGCALCYYPDYPYAVGERGGLEGKIQSGWQRESFPVSRMALRAWQEAVACYASQLSTFWNGLADMEQALESYWQSGGGRYLWRP